MYTHKLIQRHVSNSRSLLMIIIFSRTKTNYMGRNKVGLYIYRKVFKIPVNCRSSKLVASFAAIHPGSTNADIFTPSTTTIRVSFVTADAPRDDSLLVPEAWNKCKDCKVFLTIKSRDNYICKKKNSGASIKYVKSKF